MAGTVDSDNGRMTFVAGDASTDADSFVSLDGIIRAGNPSAPAGTAYGASKAFKITMVDIPDTGKTLVFRLLIRSKVSGEDPLIVHEFTVSSGTIRLDNAGTGGGFASYGTWDGGTSDTLDLGFKIPKGYEAAFNITTAASISGTCYVYFAALDDI